MTDNHAYLGPELIDEEEQETPTPASGPLAAPLVKPVRPAAPTSIASEPPRRVSRLERFERGDFTPRLTRQAAAPPASAAPEVSDDDDTDAGPSDDLGNTFTGDKLFVADYLRSTLKWTRQDIEEIFAGPESASIHYIAGRRVEAKDVSTTAAIPLPAVPATSVEQPARGSAPKIGPQKGPTALFQGPRLLGARQSVQVFAHVSQRPSL